MKNDPLTDAYAIGGVVIFFVVVVSLFITQPVPRLIDAAVTAVTEGE
jgi:hypothetical protein